jgi:hypothetical protein
MFLYVRFRFSRGYPFHGFPYWCCIWTAVKAQCGKKYWGSLALNLEVYIDIFLTAIWLTTVGNSTVHICTQTVHRTTQLIWEQCGPCPVFASYTLEFAFPEKSQSK